ncbi:hypothetical protein B0H16DRAFT_1573319 [Mycena metata]|uniref:Uncharacterized protein n=1 Tax=Mycena metata TaxID=1033252 RepID=A0AAD7MWZ7_9AGAR|nr:hypothetical protein B0H16DRAFT_1573319 [Mycena metata]
MRGRGLHTLARNSLWCGALRWLHARAAPLSAGAGFTGSIRPPCAPRVYTLLTRLDAPAIVCGVDAFGIRLRLLRRRRVGLGQLPRPCHYRSVRGLAAARALGPLSCIPESYPLPPPRILLSSPLLPPESVLPPYTTMSVCNF